MNQKQNKKNPSILVVAFSDRDAGNDSEALVMIQKSFTLKALHSLRTIWV